MLIQSTCKDFYSLMEAIKLISHELHLISKFDLPQTDDLQPGQVYFVFNLYGDIALTSSIGTMSLITLETTVYKFSRIISSCTP